MKKAVLFLALLDVLLLAFAIVLRLIPVRPSGDAPVAAAEVAAGSAAVADTLLDVEKQVTIAPVPLERPAEGTRRRPALTGRPSSARFRAADIAAMARTSPFYDEAAKVLSGKLDEDDAASRKLILDYCEHFRAAYTTRDIDFLRQVFSRHALIVVGNVVREKPDADAMATGDAKVTYSVKTKREYLERLEDVFAANARIDVEFSDFRIMRHPTIGRIYGVTLRQKYSADRYSDDGYLFLLWDFRQPEMPLVHVRTWQPAASVAGKGDIIGLGDFDFE